MEGVGHGTWELVAVWGTGMWSKKAQCLRGKDLGFCGGFWFFFGGGGALLWRSLGLEEEPLKREKASSTFQDSLGGTVVSY